MKRVLKLTALLLSVFLLGSSPKDKPDPDWDGEYEPDGQIEWTFDDGVLTVSGTGKIPDSKPWETPWVDCMDDVKTIRITGEITTIGDGAFSEFPWLETVEILSPTLKRIGACAFEGSIDLRTVIFPDCVEEIGDFAFMDTGITEITLPPSLRTIGEYAFSENRHLVSLSLPDTVESYGDYCFSNCYRLENLEIPDTPAQIGDDIMQGDVKWFQSHPEEFLILGGDYLYRYQGTEPEVTVPDGIRSIDRHCFSATDFSVCDPYSYCYDSQLYQPREDICIITLPDSVQELPESLFESMNGLLELYFGNGISTIPESICSYCENLQAVVLPDALTAIGDNAFIGCSSLLDIPIPDTLEEIGEYALDGTAWLNTADSWVVIGDGLLYRYLGYDKVLTLPEGIKTICTNAIDRSDIVSITLSSTVRKLCPKCIYSYSLVNLTLNEGLTEIPPSAFPLYDWFSYMVIPESVTTIYHDSFTFTAKFAVIGKIGTSAEYIAQDLGLKFYEYTPDTDIEELIREPASSGSDLTFDPKKDFWSFNNSMTVFSSSQYLSKQDQELVKAFSGKTDEEWGGSCLGMTITAILAKNGVFSPSQIDSQADSLRELEPTSAVQSMINYYQSTQSSDIFREQFKAERISVMIYRTICTAKQIPHGVSPILICFETGKNMHAVVGYGSETGSWRYYSRDWTERILIYDPNTASFEDRRCLYYDPVSLTFCIPYYGIFHDGRDTSSQMYFRVSNNLSLLNAYPYPFDERFLTGDTNCDGMINAADAEALMQHLLCKKLLSADGFRQADLNRDGRVNAVDLTLLKRSLL